MSQNEKTCENCGFPKCPGHPARTCKSWQPKPEPAKEPVGEEKKCEYCGSWSCDGCVGSLRHELAETKKQLDSDWKFQEIVKVRKELAATNEYIRCVIIITPEEEQERQGLKKELAEKVDLIIQLHDLVKRKDKELAEKDKRYLAATDDMIEKYKVMDSLRNELAEAKATITAMHCAMAEKDKEIANLKTTLDAAQNLTVEAISAYAGKVAMS